MGTRFCPEGANKKLPSTFQEKKECDLSAEDEKQTVYFYANGCWGQNLKNLNQSIITENGWPKGTLFCRRPKSHTEVDGGGRLSDKEIQAGIKLNYDGVQYSKDVGVRRSFWR